MKSYSKWNPYNKELIPGLLVNGRLPPGPGWIEVGPKVSCPDPNNPDDPDNPDTNTDLTLPIPAQMINSTDTPKLRIISKSIDGTTITTDYIINVISMSTAQLQAYLTQNLSIWGYWNTINSLVSLVPYIKMRVDSIQIFYQLVALPPQGS